MRKRRMSALLLAVAVITGCAGAESSAPKTGEVPAPTDSPGPYLMAYFTGDGADGLRLAGSDDGFRWAPLFDGRVVLRPTIGKARLLRDPHLLRGPDGVYHLVWTASGNEPVIGYASSTDLVTWSEQRPLAVMAGEPDAKNAWAPKLFYDESRRRFMITWSSTIRGRFAATDRSAEKDWNHRIYYTTTRDFESLAPPRLLYDPGFTVIDALIVRDDARYLMFVKDERRNPWQKHIVLATAPAPEGPWSAPSPPITGGYPAEGPSTIKISRTRFVYFEKYAVHQMGLAMSMNLTDWKDVSELLNAPPYARHPSVLSIPSEMLARLRRLP